ncbi:MAG: family 43 glycosylhydrolase [Acidimicrobiales bacterium]|nr:family 43 glycosylhydrolase [Acidimicrobiales bacterium]
MIVASVLAVALTVAISVAALAGPATTPARSTTVHSLPAAVSTTLPAAGPATVAAVSPPAAANPQSPGLLVSSGQNQSDPFLYLSGGRYFLYASGVPGTPPVNVPVASTTTFDHWSQVSDALPALPAWAVPGFTWAPDIHRFGSTFVLYFTALLQGSSPPMQCIGDAIGRAADGPFTPFRTPFICQTDQGGSIDPRVFTDGSGANWMLFKSDQNIDGATTPTKMWSQPLTADGLGLVGQPSELMAPDERWQGSIVEAPDMVEVNGTYWVVYSGNWFNQPSYGIGAARCAGPAGPCADISPRPLLGSNLQGEGPGEASVFKDSAGVWMLYSPWRSLAPKPDKPPRPVYITRLGFGSTGPYLAAGGPPPSL